MRPVVPLWQEYETGGNVISAVVVTYQKLRAEGFIGGLLAEEMGL